MGKRKVLVLGFIILFSLLLLILYFKTLFPFTLRVSMPDEFPDVSRENNYSPGDVFIVRIIEKNDLTESEKLRSSKINPAFSSYFDVWINDSKTGEMKKVFTFFNNNPNAPSADAYEDKVIIGTWTLDHMILLDTKTGLTTNFSWPAGYTADTYHPPNDPPKIYLYKNYVIFPAYKKDSYSTDTIFKYDIEKSTYEAIVELKTRSGCKYHVADIYVSNRGYLYWYEFDSEESFFCGPITFRKKI